ncbi:MAG: TfoX/Sxy family protein [Litoreibacter sp.]|nr:TfoX/Sxy family protein [Litoreibacter sp.]
MSVSDADIAFARDLFSPLGRITHRKMMGGATLYADGALFGLVDGDGAIYLRARGALAEFLADEGAAQFTYERNSETISMGYWSLPESALDDPEQAAMLARRAVTEG